MDRFTEIGESTKLLISKHHKDPKNLYPFWPTQKSSMLVINDYEKIIRDYDSNRKWVWNNQMTILGCLNIASNLWICYKIRRYLNLHSTMKGFFHTLIPSTVFSVRYFFGHKFRIYLYSMQYNCRFSVEFLVIFILSVEI